MAPILEQLDPYQQTTRLFSDKLNFKDGHYVKDLSLLGRPLDKVVMIEHNPDSYHGQESNLIKLKPWKGDVRDRTLYDLITFLRCKSYNDFLTIKKGYITKVISQCKKNWPDLIIRREQRCY